MVSCFTRNFNETSAVCCILPTQGIHVIGKYFFHGQLDRNAHNISGMCRPLHVCTALTRIEAHGFHRQLNAWYRRYDHCQPVATLLSPLSACPNSMIIIEVLHIWRHILVASDGNHRRFICGKEKAGRREGGRRCSRYMLEN